MTTALGKRAFTIGRPDRLETIERPLDLLLQREIILDDQQWLALVAAHLALDICRSEACRGSNKGRPIVITVPRPSSVSTEMLPPSSRTYWRLSYAPMPIPVCLVVWKGLNSRV